VKRCIAAGVLSIDVRPVEQEMLQVVHHPVPTRLKNKNYKLRKFNSNFFIAFRPTLQRKSHSCIPRKGIARPQSQFTVPCVCERFIYLQNRQNSRIGRTILGIYKWLTDI
jgi:hypothetical protein